MFQCLFDNDNVCDNVYGVMTMFVAMFVAMLLCYFGDNVCGDIVSPSLLLLV